MKATGTIRRIDDLGRIVLPKEIRRTMHLREGDPVEIFIDSRNQVILKKYSPIDALDFATEFAEAIFDTTGYIAIITDTDVSLAVAGGTKKKYVGKPLGSVAQTTLRERTSVLMNNLDQFTKDKALEFGDVVYPFKSQVVTPIVSQGSVLGTVIIGDELGNDLESLEVKLAEVAARFLAKSIE